jgi:hypothetical protein
MLSPGHRIKYPMIKKILFMPFLILIAININAQQPNKPTKNKQAEQNEIKADQHLQKELQQKQLTMKPERLVYSPAQQEEIKEKKKTITSEKSKTIKRKSKSGRK